MFEALVGPVAASGVPSAFHRGLRTVALGGTGLHVPDDAQITWRDPERRGEMVKFGYPLLRLLALVECGTRAILAACFGPETDGELSYAARLLGCRRNGMLLLLLLLLLADAGFHAAWFLSAVGAHEAQLLVRASARRRQTITRRLPDGS